MNIIETIERARFVSVPRIYITTPDPQALIAKLYEARVLRSAHAINEDSDEEVPVIQWDIAAGFKHLNHAGQVAIASKLVQMPLVPPNMPEIQRQQVMKQVMDAMLNPQEALSRIGSLPPNSVIFFIVLSPTEFFKDPKRIQTIWSLRDSFKESGHMLIFVGPHFTLPPSLANDTLILNDPYPTVQELEGIVKKRCESVKANNPEAPDISVVDITSAAYGMQGLTSFGADTAISMAFNSEGKIDFQELREQRYAKIETVPGLKIWRGKESIDDLKGIDGAARELKRWGVNPKRRVGCVVYVDEIDKEFRGINGGDLSGMADKQFGKTLKFMEDNKIPGILLLGLPGTGKTAISKAIGNDLRVPTLMMDFGDMRSKWMGDSEAHQEQAFATILAISGGYPLFLGSCNSAEDLPSALMRRFKTRFFFDLLGREEKDQIWQVKMRQYEIEPQNLPDDTDWTGAEIDVCCEKVWFSGGSLIEAAETVIPVARVRSSEVDQLRAQAHNAYVDARTGKPYQYNGIVTAAAAVKPTNGRQVTLRKV